MDDPLLGRIEGDTSLLRRWQRLSERRARHEVEGAAWRQWNRGESQAIDVIGPHAASIRAVQHETCPRRPNRGGTGAQPLSAPAGR